MKPHNVNDRLELFSDGVFAIAITLLVLDIKVPPLETMKSESDVWHALVDLWPSLFAFSWSFIIILISWLGHHNLFKNVIGTSNQFMLANGFFLFTVIILPFPTAFMAEYLKSEYARPAIVVYCLFALIHNLGWNMLWKYIFKPIPLMSPEHIALAKKTRRGARSGLLIYSSLTLLALWLPYVALILSLLTWIFWLYLSIKVHHE